MAVYKRTYKRYAGDLTAHRWRFLILSRYAFRTVFESRLMTSFFTACFLPHLIAGSLIYLRYNAAALEAINLTGRVAQALQLLDVGPAFYLTVFTVQTYLSFLLITFLGPNLIAPDVANN